LDVACSKTVEPEAFALLVCPDNPPKRRIKKKIYFHMQSNSPFILNREILKIQLKIETLSSEAKEKRSYYNKNFTQVQKCEIE